MSGRPGGTRPRIPGAGASRDRERGAAQELAIAGLLLVAAVACVVAAVQADAKEQVASEPVSGPVTPVLSPRRVPTLLAAPVADRRLQAALTDLVARTPGTSCLTVAASGRSVFSHNPDQALVPASLEKLLTATAALEALGPATTLPTVVAAAAPPTDGVVDGDLYLVGGGDPLLMTDDYERHFRNQPQIASDLEALADAVVAAGVREVRGGIVGDESRYDRTRYVATWPARFIEQDQTGPLSALTVNDGFVAFPPHPDTTTPDEEPAPDPAVHAAETLRALLTARGVTVAEPARSGTAPGQVIEVVGFESPPVQELTTEMLRESDNMTAELLVKELGYRAGGSGSTSAGVAAVTSEIAELGLPTGGSVVADGSGLAEGNRQTCGLLQGLLDRSGPESPLAGGLAVAGQTGTLSMRYVGTAVAGRMRAKTGTLNQVASLAGYVDTVPGAEVSFTFVVNLAPPDRVDQPDFDLQDELAEILIRYPEGPALADLEPKPAAQPAAGG